MTTPIACAAALLESAIEHRGIGYAKTPYIDTLTGAPSSFQLAVIHAIHEMLWVATSSHFDEDSHTASLMGHLATNIGWYSLMERWSPSENAPTVGTTLYWAQQSKATEGLKGADFGLALREDSEEIRIALFQAKKVGVNQRADTNRAPSIKFLDAADKCLIHLLNGNSFIQTSGANQHQIYKMAWTDAFGSDLVGIESAPAWVHYVFWNQSDANGQNAVAPTFLPVWDAIEQVHRNRRGREELSLIPDDYFVVPGTLDFISMLTEGLRYNGNDCCLVVDMTLAQKLVGNLAELIPVWLLADTTGSSGGVGLWQTMFGQDFRIGSPLSINSATVTASPSIRPPPPIQGLSHSTPGMSR